MMLLPVSSNTPSIIKEFKNNEFYRLNLLGRKIVCLQEKNNHAMARLHALRLLFETCVAILYQTVKLSITAVGIASGLVAEPAIKLTNHVVYLDKTTKLKDVKITSSRIGRGDATSTRRKLARLLPKVLKSIPTMGNFIGTIVKIVKLSLMIPLILTVGLVSPDAMLNILHKCKFISLSRLAKQERENEIIAQAKMQERNYLNAERKNRLITKISDLEMASTKEKLLADGGELSKRLQAKVELKRQKVRAAYKKKHNRDIDETFAVLDLMLSKKTYKRVVYQWLEQEEKKGLKIELSKQKILLRRELEQAEIHAIECEMEKYFKAVEEMITVAGFGTKNEKSLSDQQIKKILDRFDFSQERRFDLEAIANNILTETRFHHDKIFKNNFLKKVVKRSLLQEKVLLLKKMLETTEKQKNAKLTEQETRNIEEIVQNYFNIKEIIIQKTRVGEVDEANINKDQIKKILNKYDIPQNLKKDLKAFALNAVKTVKSYHSDMSMKGLLLTREEHDDFVESYYKWNLTGIEGGRLVVVEDDEVIVTQEFLKEFYPINHFSRKNERARIGFELIESRDRSLENRLINEWLSVEKGIFAGSLGKDLKSQVKEIYQIKKLMVEAIRFAQANQGASFLSDEIKLEKHLIDEKEAIIGKILQKAQDKSTSKELQDRRYASLDKITKHYDLKMAIFKSLKMQDQNGLEFDASLIESLLSKVDIPASEKDNLKNFAMIAKDILELELKSRKVKRETVISHRQQYQIHQHAMKELKKLIPKRVDLQQETLGDVEPTNPNLLLQDSRFAKLEQRQIRLMTEAKEMYLQASKIKTQDSLDVSKEDEAFQDRSFDIVLDDVEIPYNIYDPYSRWDGVQTHVKNEIVYKFLYNKKINKEITSEEFDDLIAKKKHVAKEAAKVAKKWKPVLKNKYKGLHGINHLLSMADNKLARVGANHAPTYDSAIKVIERLEKQLAVVDV